MPRAKYNWFFFVKNVLYKYPNELGTSKQAEIQREGIKRAIEETEKLDSGRDRMRLIEFVYFRNIYTISGAAQRIHIADQTAQRWSRDFIYLCAKYMGYL